MNAQTLLSHGYFPVREIPGQGWCGLYQMAYTTGLFCGLEAMGYQKRFCYARRKDAEQALSTWTGVGDPPGPWIVEKPGDRQGPGAAEAEEEAGVI